MACVLVRPCMPSSPPRNRAGRRSCNATVRLSLAPWHFDPEEKGEVTVVRKKPLFTSPGLFPAVFYHTFIIPTCLTSPLFQWDRDWVKYLTQLLLISLVAHNSHCLSVLWMRTLMWLNYPLLFSFPPFPLPLSFVFCVLLALSLVCAGVQCCCCTFPGSCVTVQRSCCVASSISSSPGGMVTVGNGGPENWPSFQYSRKTFLWLLAELVSP